METSVRYRNLCVHTIVAEAEEAWHFGNNKGYLNAHVSFSLDTKKQGKPKANYSISTNPHLILQIYCNALFYKM